ncbi:MAG TPA: FAD-dependent oxidoreductase, partial [Thermoanaerobaculia bacterium]|nr:FAD-dependent oxidoreductase [Thermoanaerobaculia bacterium]
RTVLWAAGVAGSPLAAAIAKETGAPLDRAGRIEVLPDLTVAGHPEIFVIGDVGALRDSSGKPLPGVAQVAMQEGRYVGKVIGARLEGRKAPAPFRYFDPGSMATIGRAAAIADIRGLRLTGYPAWLFWLFLHLMFLVKFGNRLLVFIQWAWSYLTWNRSARLITGEERGDVSRAR